MYDAFDSYLVRSAWYADHVQEDQAFFTSLRRVVDLDGFDADRMGEYMRKAKSVDRDNPDHDQYNSTIDRRVVEASAIRDYLHPL